MKLFRITFLFIGLGLLFSCSKEKIADDAEKGVFVVSYPNGYAPKTEMIYLSLSDLKQHYGLTNFSNIQLVSMNNHKQLPFKLYDLDGDNSAELLGFSLDINPKEPLRPFVLYQADKSEEHAIESLDGFNNNTTITYLQSARNLKTDPLSRNETPAQNLYDF